MTAKDIMQIFSKLSGVARSNVVKRCLYALVLIAGLGTLGPVSFQKVQQTFWLSNSTSFIFHPHSLDNSIQDNCVLLDNDLDNDRGDFTDSQIFHELFLAANLKLLTSPLNSNWEIFFDAIKSSPYISIFVSLPLRSPPLFS